MASHGNVQLVQNHYFNEALKLVIMALSAIVVAYGLSLLVAHDFLDGGVTGLSILAERITGVPMGLWLALLNLPFIIMAWFKLGRRTAVRTLVGILTLAIASVVFHHMPAITDERWLAFFSGGLMLGAGIGTAIRFGGALDGTEALAAILADRISFDIDQVILAINVGIFTLAAFFVGVEPALASGMLFFFVVSPIIGRITSGDNSVKFTRIITDHPEDIAGLIEGKLHRKVAMEQRKVWKDGGFAPAQASELQMVMSRLEESELAEMVKDIDPRAVILMSDITSHHGLHEHL